MIALFNVERKMRYKDMKNINANELLEEAYVKMFEDAMSKRYKGELTMKSSGLKFRIFSGNEKVGDTFKWQIQFNDSIDFGFGNWKTFYLKSDRELGKFLFDCSANNGLPKGAIGIIQ